MVDARRPADGGTRGEKNRRGRGHGRGRGGSRGGRAQGATGLDRGQQKVVRGGGDSSAGTPRFPRGKAAGPGNSGTDGNAPPRINDGQQAALKTPSWAAIAQYSSNDSRDGSTARGRAGGARGRHGKTGGEETWPELAVDHGGKNKRNGVGGGEKSGVGYGASRVVPSIKAATKTHAAACNGKSNQQQQQQKKKKKKPEKLVLFGGAASIKVVTESGTKKTLVSGARMGRANGEGGGKRNNDTKAGKGGRAHGAGGAFAQTGLHVAKNPNMLDSSTAVVLERGRTKQKQKKKKLSKMKKIILAEKAERKAKRESNSTEAAAADEAAEDPPQQTKSDEPLQAPTGEGADESSDNDMRHAGRDIGSNSSSSADDVAAAAGGLVAVGSPDMQDEQVVGTTENSKRDLTAVEERHAAPRSVDGSVQLSKPEEGANITQTHADGDNDLAHQNTSSAEDDVKIGDGGRSGYKKAVETLSTTKLSSSPQGGEGGVGSGGGGDDGDDADNQDEDFPALPSTKAAARAGVEPTTSSSPEDAAWGDGKGGIEQNIGGDEEPPAGDGEEEAQGEGKKKKAKRKRKRRPKVRGYCDQMLTSELDSEVTFVLSELCRFQERLRIKDPQRAKMKRRMVCGLREVQRGLRGHAVKCVFVAPDVEPIESEGGLDDALQWIITTCRNEGIECVFALDRRGLAKAINKPRRFISVVGVYDLDGVHETFRKVKDLAAKGRETWRARQQQGA